MESVLESSPDFASLHGALKQLVADIASVQKDSDGFPLNPDRKKSQQALLDEVRSHDTLFASDFQGWSPDTAYNIRSRILTDLRNRWNRLYQEIHPSKIQKAAPSVETIDTLANGILHAVKTSLQSPIAQQEVVKQKPNWENW